MGDKIHMSIMFYSITQAQASELLSTLLEVSTSPDIGEVNVHYGPEIDPNEEG